MKIAHTNQCYVNEPFSLSIKQLVPDGLIDFSLSGFSLSKVRSGAFVFFVRNLILDPDFNSSVGKLGSEIFDSVFSLSLPETLSEN